VTQHEILGLRLLSLHNLWFVLDLTARARAAIERGAFSSFRAETLARLARGPEEDLCPPS
jgi:queuine tRNA-ribosyltransferase